MVCGEKEKTIDNLFTKCDFVAQVWSLQKNIKLTTDIADERIRVGNCRQAIRRHIFIIYHFFQFDLKLNADGYIRRQLYNLFFIFLILFKIKCPSAIV